MSQRVGRPCARKEEENKAKKKKPIKIKIVGTPLSRKLARQFHKQVMFRAARTAAAKTSALKKKKEKKPISIKIEKKKKEKKPISIKIVKKKKEKKPISIKIKKKKKENQALLSSSRSQDALSNIPSSAPPVPKRLTSAQKDKLMGRTSAPPLDILRREVNLDVGSPLDIFRREDNLDIGEIVRRQTAKEDLKEMVKIHKAKKRLAVRIGKKRVNEVNVAKLEKANKLRMAEAGIQVEEMIKINQAKKRLAVRAGKARVNKVNVAKLKKANKLRMAEASRQISSTVAGKRARGQLKSRGVSYARAASVQSSRAGSKTFAQIVRGIS